MAMIKCPECGQEVSDKAKKCIYCEKVLIEDVYPTKYCVECGKEIPFDAQECSFCGCPAEQKKTESTAIAQIISKVNKKSLIIVAVMVVVIVIGLFISIGGPTLNEDEQFAYQSAVELKNMMKDPDSFRLYDEMFLLKKHDDDGDIASTYLIFEYGGTNGYGAIIKSEAVFDENGKYIMDYGDEIDYDDLDMVAADAMLMTWSFNKRLGKDDDWEVVEINVEKIKDKMGLE